MPSEIPVKPVAAKQERKRRIHRSFARAVVEARKVAPPGAQLQLRTLEDQMLVETQDGRHLVRGGVQLDVPEFAPSQYNKADGTMWKLNYWNHELPADFGYSADGSLVDLLKDDKIKQAELGDYNMYGPDEPVPVQTVQSALPSEKRYNAHYQFYQLLLAAQRNGWQLSVVVRSDDSDLAWGSFVTSGKNGTSRDVVVTLEKVRLDVTLKGEVPMPDFAK